MSKRLPDKAVYSDVVNRGLILPLKKKYTMRDFRKLVGDGWDQLDARWIIICSHVFHHANGKLCELSKLFWTEKFLINCELGLATL